jgi:hypothetical protein
VCHHQRASPQPTRPIGSVAQQHAHDHEKDRDEQPTEHFAADYPAHDPGAYGVPWVIPRTVRLGNAAYFFVSSSSVSQCGMFGGWRGGRIVEVRDEILLETTPAWGLTEPCAWALYARVSLDQQAKSGTIDSQVAAVRERIAADGELLADDLCFIDAGVSGATLVRPQLERLRDHAALGVIDRL